MALDRAPLLADETLSGVAWCQAHSGLIDAWLADLFWKAAPSSPRGMALVAVGGYGRSELCPNSDIDVMLVHDGDADIGLVADQIWYPIWDMGLHLGHSVGTVREVLQLAAGDLDTATALLSARHVAGDDATTAEVAELAVAQWRKRSKRWLSELATRVELRHQRAGEVAFRLEPDLKEGRGGLRDVHALRWAEVAQPILVDNDAVSLELAYAVILDARVELQRCTGRSANVLALQEQPAVAAALGQTGPEQLMARVAEAARSIAWTSDDAWRRVASVLRTPLARIAGRKRMLATGIVLRDGEVEVDASSAPLEDPLLTLRAASMAARHDTVIERYSLERLVLAATTLADPWPPEARSLFVDLLTAGAPAIHVIEALDQRGIWTRILPEWQAVRARPQHNAYHRFTVDRHLLETAANAATFAGDIDRPDLLVVAALLHDLGKGSDGDHTEAGVELIGRIGARMGYAEQDVATLVALVEHHLLLPEVATRRDLDDVAMLERVATTIGSVLRLRMLAALTEADAKATGPAAWSPWKAELVGQLVERLTQILAGAEPGTTVGGTFPTPGQLARLADGSQRIEIHDGVVTVMTEDRPGAFSRVAGVLALHGLDVLAAAAYSSTEGRALSEFRVVDPVRDETPWQRVTRDLELALDGRLAVPARVAERARMYARRDKPRGGAEVHFDNEASDEATVIDVHAPDAIGVLYRLTRAMAELDLDIRSARVQTLGATVVDAFYVRDRNGGKVTDRHELSEIERAILHSLTE